MDRFIKKVFLKSGYVFDGKKIYVQSMLNKPAKDLKSNIMQAKELEINGCEILRVAILDFDSLKLISALKKEVKIPIVADIHFDYRLAIEAVKSGVDKIRINPGNIGDENKIKAVAEICKNFNVPIRIGVNSGSLEKSVLKKHINPKAAALVESAVNNVKLLEKFDFKNIVVSMKSPNVNEVVKAYRLFRKKLNYPLHIGVTEAGTEKMASIKSAIGIGALLVDGIGETIRVSITGDPLKEVEIGHKILKALNLEKNGVEIVSCPTCGRTKIDVIALTNKIENMCNQLKKPLKIAVMGCAVNGPGEAKEADIGLAGGDGFAVLFKKGKIFAKVEEKDIFQILASEIAKF